jgi:hypothetical protein
MVSTVILQKQILHLIIKTTVVLSRNACRIFQLVLIFCLPLINRAGTLTILQGVEPGAIEDYAARELSRYVYALSGNLPIITSGKITTSGYIIGRRGTHPLIDDLLKQAIGPQGYVLKKMKLNGQEIILIAANDETGVLYGVYGLLEDHYGIQFNFDGDVLPPAADDIALFPAIDETKTPMVAIRGFLPWTNFPQSATSYSWDDWKYILDQMARMRMNFLQIHNYNGEEGHNEMFHNFEVDGNMSRVWMATARSGHAWGSYPGWDVNKYLFGADALFDDYDFGADCALHNEKLNNKQVFRKGVNEFQRVIAYAHKRGIKIGLGLDINLIPDSYHKEPDDPKVMAARVKQIETDYPNLDYLLCFQSESLTDDTPEAEKMRQRWRTIFDAFYVGLKKNRPQLRLAVAGWGLRAADVASLPTDVICAPISKYSDAFEDGHIYKDHEYWGCPWMERDIYSSLYYYPYNMHLSNTVKAWQQRAPNMSGFYTLTWRITDAVQPKLWFVARAPWDAKNELSSGEVVYRKFAEQQYGKKAAALVTPIINQNEPFATDWSECRLTPPFDLGPANRRGQYLINLQSLNLSDGNGRELVKRAVSYTSQFQIRKVPGPDGQQMVGYTFNGSWLAYNSIQFDSAWKLVKLTVASGSEGGRIELHLDSASGPLVGEGEVENTGGGDHWKEMTIPLEPQTGSHVLYLVIREREAFVLANAQLHKANEQLPIIEQAIDEAGTAGQKYRLGLLKSRIAAARDHIMLNMYAGNRSYDINEMTSSWVNHFNSRVTDISSLGNVVSVQNRFIQKNYSQLAAVQLNTYQALPPGNLVVKGTRLGARLCWKTDHSGYKGFAVYRDGKRVNDAWLPASTKEYDDTVSGQHKYELRSLYWGNDAEKPSIIISCLAGAADKTGPQIVVISPPTSIMAGQPVAIKARLLDNRVDELLMATLYYRKPGETSWTKLPMTRKVKAVFTAAIPASAIDSDGIQYYVSATDGDNDSVFPADAPLQPLSLVQEPSMKPSVMPAPKLIPNRQSIQWQAVQGANYYQIYRSQRNNFIPAPDNLLTYLAADATLTFTDNGVDLLGQPLKGTWHYRVTAVDKNGYESKPSLVAAINYTGQ